MTAVPRASDGSGTTRAGIVDLIGLIVVGLLFVLVRLECWRHLQLNPDAMSYWNVGRNLALRHSFQWSIKPYFYPDDGRIIEPVVGYTSVPFTLLVAALQAMGCGFRLACALNGVLVLVDALLLAPLARCVGGSVGWAAALIFVVNPGMIEASTTLWTEPLALCCMMAAYLLAAGCLIGAAPGEGRSKSATRITYWRALACGLLLGVGYLTRPADGVFLAAILAPAFMARRWPAAGRCLLGFLLVVAPYWASNLLQNGSPSYSMYSLLGRTFFYGSAMYTGFGRAYPPVGPFVRDHPHAIIEAILRNLRLSETLLLKPWYLGVPVAAALLTWAVGPWLRRPSSSLEGADRGLLVAVIAGAALSLGFNCSAWSTHEENRFVLASWSLGLVIAAALINSGFTGPKLSTASPAAGVFGSHPRPLRYILALGSAAGLCWMVRAVPWAESLTLPCPAGRQTWRERQFEQYRAALRPLQGRAGSDLALAASDPWMVNYVIDCPTVLLPALRPGELWRFLARYRPDWIVADPGRMPKRSDRDDFGAEVRSRWHERDWTLERLAQSPLLQRISTHGTVTLYRVKTDKMVEEPRPSPR